MSLSPPATSSHSRRDADLPLGVSVHRGLGPASCVATIVLNRPHRRNGVDGPTARALHRAFVEAEVDPSVSAIVLYGAGGTFCAGADLSAVAAGDEQQRNPLKPVKVRDEDRTCRCQNGVGSASAPMQGQIENVTPLEPVPHIDDIGPMGPTRLVLTKPTIAAISGWCVAGGLELACWCDLRVAESDAHFGVFCRRFGVPLIDGGTVRLPRLIGLSRAMDLILTGRQVDAAEAFSIGLVNRLCQPGSVRAAAESLALSLTQFPQICMRADRWSAIHQHNLGLTQALANEFRRGVQVVEKEGKHGARRFAKDKQGRHGAFQQVPIKAPTRHRLSPPNASSASQQHSLSSPSMCVLFDLGGVVVDSPVDVILTFEHERGLPKHSINLALARSQAFKQLECGNIDLEEFVKRFEEEWKIGVQRTIKQSSESGATIGPTPNVVSSLPPLTSSTIHQLFERMVSVRPRPEMISAIRALRRQGFIVGCVTNNWKRSREDPSGLIPAPRWAEENFDFIVESCVVGMRKPQHEIWAHAFDRCKQLIKQRQSTQGSLELHPHACIFLDDLGVNLKAARQFGFKTIKVTNAYGDALKELSELVGTDLLCPQAPTSTAASTVSSGMVSNGSTSVSLIAKL